MLIGSSEHFKQHMVYGKAFCQNLAPLKFLKMPKKLWSIVLIKAAAKWGHPWNFSSNWLPTNHGLWYGKVWSGISVKLALLKMIQCANILICLAGP